MSLSLSKISGYNSSYDVLGYLLRLMSSIWHRQLNADLAKIDLTEMQFVMLIGLGWLEESDVTSVTQRQLADACGISTALASQIMKQLVRKSVVEVGTHAKDARARTVKLSKLGEGKLKDAVLILRKADEAFRADDPKVFDQLFKALKEAIDVKMQTVDQHPEALGGMPRSEPSRKRRKA